jgi:hypothetical protein
VWPMCHHRDAGPSLRSATRSDAVEAAGEEGAVHSAGPVVRRARPRAGPGEDKGGLCVSPPLTLRKSRATGPRPTRLRLGLEPRNSVACARRRPSRARLTPTKSRAQRGMRMAFSPPPMTERSNRLERSSSSATHFSLISGGSVASVRTPKLAGAAAAADVERIVASDIFAVPISPRTFVRNNTGRDAPPRDTRAPAHAQGATQLKGRRVGCGWWVGRSVGELLV